MLLATGLVAAALIGQTAAEETTKTPTEFTFRGITAGQQVDSKIKLGCFIKVGPKRVCMPNGDVGGEPAVIQITLINNTLSELDITAARKSFPILLDLFGQRYGKPCANRVDKWQNVSGASLDDQVFEWCFVTGKLILREIGNQVNETEATYSDSIITDDKPHQVDF
ncbi:MAG TPA: hypothetical protein VII73_08945 [Caulobacteraceae bacterium]